MFLNVEKGHKHPKPPKVIDAIFLHLIFYVHHN
jgi:hypothetical protein